MSAIARAQRNKDAELRRWSPTGHRAARPNQQPMHQRDLNRYLPLSSSATKPRNLVAPKPQIIASNRVRPNQTQQPRRSNPHNARGTVAPFPYRGFLPGGFRTPAAVLAPTAMAAGIRNPSQ